MRMGVNALKSFSASLVSQPARPRGQLQGQPWTGSGLSSWCSPAISASQLTPVVVLGSVQDPKSKSLPLPAQEASGSDPVPNFLPLQLPLGV